MSRSSPTTLHDITNTQRRPSFVKSLEAVRDHAVARKAAKQALADDFARSNLVDGFKPASPASTMTQHHMENSTGDSHHDDDTMWQDHQLASAKSATAPNSPRKHDSACFSEDTPYHGNGLDQPDDDDEEVHLVSRSLLDAINNDDNQPGIPIDTDDSQHGSHSSSPKNTMPGGWWDYDLDLDLDGAPKTVEEMYLDEELAAIQDDDDADSFCPKTPPYTGGGRLETIIEQSSVATSQHTTARSSIDNEHTSLLHKGPRKLVKKSKSLPIRKAVNNRKRNWSLTKSMDEEETNSSALQQATRSTSAGSIPTNSKSPETVIARSPKYGDLTISSMSTTTTASSSLKRPQQSLRKTSDHLKDIFYRLTTSSQQRSLERVTLQADKRRTVSMPEHVHRKLRPDSGYRSVSLQTTASTAREACCDAFRDEHHAECTTLNEQGVAKTTLNSAKLMDALVRGSGYHADLAIASQEVIDGTVTSKHGDINRSLQADIENWLNNDLTTGVPRSLSPQEEVFLSALRRGADFSPRLALHQYNASDHARSASSSSQLRALAEEFRPCYRGSPSSTFFNNATIFTPSPLRVRNTPACLQSSSEESERTFSNLSSLDRFPLPLAYIDSNGLPQRGPEHVQHNGDNQKTAFEVGTWPQHDHHLSLPRDKSHSCAQIPSLRSWDAASDALALRSVAASDSSNSLVRGTPLTKFSSKVQGGHADLDDPFTSKLAQGGQVKRDSALQRSGTPMPLSDTPSPISVPSPLRLRPQGPALNSYSIFPQAAPTSLSKRRPSALRSFSSTFRLPQTILGSIRAKRDSLRSSMRSPYKVRQPPVAHWENIFTPISPVQQPQRRSSSGLRPLLGGLLCGLGHSQSTSSSPARLNRSRRGGYARRDSIREAWWACANCMGGGGRDGSESTMPPVRMVGPDRAARVSW